MKLSYYKKSLSILLLIIFVIILSVSIVLHKPQHVNIYQSMLDQNRDTISGLKSGNQQEISSSIANITLYDQTGLSEPEADAVIDLIADDTWNPMEHDVAMLARLFRERKDVFENRTINFICDHQRLSEIVRERYRILLSAISPMYSDADFTDCKAVRAMQQYIISRSFGVEKPVVGGKNYIREKEREK